MISNEDNILFRVSLKFIAVWSCGWPAFGFVTCVLLSIWLHFESSTQTHCRVQNFLPSISAAVGDNTPERYIWRICICLHVVPRFLIAWCYKNFYWNSPLKPRFVTDEYYWLCWLCTFLQVAEDLSLMMLTYISSSENKDLHQTSFMVFVALSFFYMLLTLYMFNYSGRRRSASQGEKSFQIKSILFTIYCSAFLLSLYFFNRHNTYCEPGMYSMFAACEYVVVLTNIAFHGTVIFDMNDKYLAVLSLVPGDVKGS